MKWKGSYLAMVVVGGFALSAGCLATSAKVFPAQAEAPVAGAPSEAEAVAEEQQKHAACDEGCAIVPGIDLESIVFVLDDPRLAEVKQAYENEAYAEAAKSLEAALVSTPPEDESEVQRWAFQLGRLHALAGDHEAAAKAYDLVSPEDFALWPYARLGAAQAHARMGRSQEALARAQTISEDVPIYPTARLLVAEIHAARGEKESAIAIWREHLERDARPLGWSNVALDLAEALLEGMPSPQRAEEAALLARRVIIEAPTSSVAPRAYDLHRRALARLPESRRFSPLKMGKLGEVSAPLSPVEHVARASALMSAGRRSEALGVLDSLLSAPRSKLGEEASCKANLLKARILARQRERAKANDAYERAISLCEAFPNELADALFGGARVASQLNRCEQAMARYERIERELPSHSYADDARLRGALCALELGDRAKHEAMLRTIADDYPNGDMASDGLFRLALQHMIDEHWEDALELLDKAIAIWPREYRHWAAGRAQYFRGKALAKLGRRDEAETQWAHVIRDYPLAFYMLKSYARLSERDPAIARQLLDAALEREPRGPFQLADLPIFRGPAFARIVELVRAGEIDAARKEVQALNLTAEDVPNDALWAVALIYARTGSAQLAHLVPRSLLKDWLHHYPVGKWRVAWELAYPRPYSDLIEREAEKNGIRKSLAYAVMRDESAFDAGAVSPARAYGLMQLIVPTAKGVGKKIGINPDATSLKNPEVNIALGCRFLADLQKRFSSNPLLAIPSYNAGPGGPLRWLSSREVDDFDLWIEKIPYLETRRYTQRVLASYAAYLFLYERDAIDDVFKLPSVVN